MVILIVGVFVLPVFGFDQRFMTYAFGLAILLFMGCPFGWVGHYELYKVNMGSRQPHFPRQEKVVISVIAGLAVIYVTFVMAITYHLW